MSLNKNFFNLENLNLVQNLLKYLLVHCKLPKF